MPQKTNQDQLGIYEAFGLEKIIHRQTELGVGRAGQMFGRLYLLPLAPSAGSMMPPNSAKRKLMKIPVLTMIHFVSIPPLATKSFSSFLMSFCSWNNPPASP